MNFIINATDREIEKLKEEFGMTADSSNEVAELQQVFDFLNSVKEDFTILHGAKDYKKIMKCWPTILNTSFFSVFQQYIDSNFLTVNDS